MTGELTGSGGWAVEVNPPSKEPAADGRSVSSSTNLRLGEEDLRKQVVVGEQA